MIASYDAALKKASEQARKVAWVNTLGWFNFFVLWQEV